LSAWLSNEGDGFLELTLDRYFVLGSNEPDDRVVGETFLPFEFPEIFARDGDLFAARSA
jgi:hypothetical protein